MLRHALVSGKFYSSDASELETEVNRYVVPDSKKAKARAVLSPHAGFMYSGSVAGAVYSAIEMPRTFVLLGPNHTGRGQRISVMLEGAWEIPTAVFDIDGELASEVLKTSTLVSEDYEAHSQEHSLEVQLPFIAHFTKEAKIVPISIMSATLPELVELGRAIASAIEAVDYPVVVVASSDMSHYVSDSEAREKDTLAIEQMLGLNPEGLYDVVGANSISMCGYKPAVAALACARALGASEAQLVAYATSAEASGDYRHVVGYAGMVFK